MEFNLSSNNYNIVSHGNIFLFDKDSDLTFEIMVADEPVPLKFSLYFLSDESKEEKVETKYSDEYSVILKCYNFDPKGMGLKRPKEIAEIEGKKCYLMFWSFTNGEEQIRSVEYTIFSEK